MTDITAAQTEQGWGDWISSGVSNAFNSAAKTLKSTKDYLVNTTPGVNIIYKAEQVVDSVSNQLSGWKDSVLSIPDKVITAGTGTLAKGGWLDGSLNEKLTKKFGTEGAAEVMDALDKNPELKKSFSQAYAMEKNPEALFSKEGNGLTLNKDGLITTINDEAKSATLKSLLDKSAESSTDNFTLKTVADFGNAIQDGDYNYAAGILKDADIDAPAQLQAGAAMQDSMQWFTELTQMDNMFGEMLRSFIGFISSHVLDPNSTIGKFLNDTVGFDTNGLNELAQNNSQLVATNLNQNASVAKMTDSQFTASFNEKSLTGWADMNGQERLSAFTNTFSSAVSGSMDEMRGLEGIKNITTTFGNMADMTAQQVEQAALGMYQDMRTGETLKTSINTFTNG